MAYLLSIMSLYVSDPLELTCRPRVIITVDIDQLCGWIISITSTISTSRALVRFIAGLK